MQRGAVVVLSLGHFATDVSQGALPALLPFLIAEYQLTYTAAAFIVFSANITSTVIQPLFGYLADRASKPWLIPAAMLFSGFGIGLVGVSGHYFAVVILVMLSGIGVAAFHPEGARQVHRLTGGKNASAMSVFGVGGTLGFAVGPGLATAAVLRWGMPGTLVLVVPAVLMASALLARRLAPGAPPPAAAPDGAAAGAERKRDAWAPFARLTGTVIARAMLFYALNTFIPLYLVNVLHASKATAAAALTAFALAGVAGNLLGGYLADRAGQIRVTCGGFLVLVPLIPILLWVTSPAVIIGLLVPIGMALSSTYSPMMLLGQRYLPNHVGLASGVTLGVAISIGGVATPLLGRVADAYGLWVALASIAAVPLASTALALTLPDPDRRSLAASSR
jgi:FSR family fosmidomycin resistance protein-like MFS transporter